MRNKKGFTLVELLATIVILAVVMVITGYVIFNAIKNAREKSYKVTISEVESNANNYMMENKDKIFFITNNETGNEYQCLKVKDLIGVGYLKDTITEAKISDNTYVNKNDYIYIERDGNTKNINKSVYLKKDDYVGNKDCDTAVDALGNIVFSITPSNSTWSKTKDVTITYILKNIGGEYDLANYDYTYSYGGTHTLTKDNGSVKSINVTTTGSLVADIIEKANGRQVYGDTIFIDKIDKVGPTISLGNYKGNKKVSGSVAIPLVITDKESGVDHGSVAKDDFEVYIGTKKITSYTISHGSGDNYTLTINDSTNEGVVKITIPANKVLDKVGNGNKATTIDVDIQFKNKYVLSYSSGACKNVSGAMASETINFNATFTPKQNAYVCTGYDFNGWKDKNGTAFPIQATKWTYTENKELIAQWKVKSVKVTFYRNTSASDTTTVNQTFTYGKSGN